MPLQALLSKHVTYISMQLTSSRENPPISGEQDDDIIFEDFARLRLKGESDS